MIWHIIDGNETILTNIYEKLKDLMRQRGSIAEKQTENKEKCDIEYTQLCNALMTDL